MVPLIRVWLRRMQIRLSRRRFLFSTLLVVYLSGLGLFSVIGDRGLLATYRLWREGERLDKVISELQSDHQNLRRDIGLFRKDLRTIERYAREELHLAGENEIHYIFR